MGVVLLLGTFDTKGEEYAFVADAIRARGHDVHTMDAGILGDPPCSVSIPASEVARAGGGDLATLRDRHDRGGALEVMIRGARVLTRGLHGRGAFDGVLGLGGGGGTALVTAAMRELPVGLPKVMVSTMASGNTGPYVGLKDITMMYSVVDIAGLNVLSRRILANAVGAVCGMIEQRAADATTPSRRGASPDASHGPTGQRERPTIAATMFGVTTPCVTEARRLLEARGYDVIVFHATGSGGRAMEGLIDDGYFDAVLDVTTTEWCDEVVGGVLAAGPDRHGAAARTGIPQVVSVGALDMVNFGAAETVPERFRGRCFYQHNPTVTLMRTTPDECGAIGQRIAEQLNTATAPVEVVLPLRGVSMLDADGQPFHDPVADRALFDALRAGLAPGITVREVDAHINDPSFAAALADRLVALVPRAASETTHPQR